MSESSKYFCSCGKTTLLDGSQSCLCDEIERLLERIEELEPAVEDADTRVSEAWHEGHKEANAELCGRIEELEKERDVAEQELWYGYHITRDQIRKAWEGIMSNPSAIIRQAGSAFFAFFGIVRCKRCGGSTIEATTIDHNMYGEPVCANLPCPACHGEGWVIGGDDDRDRHAEIRSTPLTEKQIENWRRVLFDEIGPMAYELTDEQIERERAKMQQVADELAKEYPDE